MAVKQNLPEIAAGAMYVHSFLWYKEDSNGVQTPVDLTGYSAKLQAKMPGNETPVINWGTDTGEITLSSNRFDFSVDADDTAGMSFDSAEYDLLAWPTAGGVTKAVRVAYGEVSAKATITDVLQ